MGKSAGVVEWWSNGVMKGFIRVEIRDFAFANTPILQYSSAPKQLAIFTDKAIQLLPGPDDQVCYDSINNYTPC
jgi:hypothetical protein